MQGQSVPIHVIYKEIGTVKVNWSSTDNILWLPDVPLPEGFTRIYRISDGRYMYPTEGFQLDMPGTTSRYVFGGHNFQRYKGCIATSFSYDPSQYGQATVVMDRFLLLP